jgi:UDP-N-acetylmuramate dehydrogenase
MDYPDTDQPRVKPVHDSTHEVSPPAAPVIGPALCGYTTLRLGGPASALVTVTSVEEIVAAVRAASRDGAPVLVLAGGSNVVVADAGFAGTVVLLRSRGMTPRVDGDRMRLTVAAGEPWDDVVAACVAQGWAGLECLSGIPGTAGATPIQNVGAYGQEVAETIVAVEVLDRAADRVLTLTPAQCRFAYRSSVFKYDDRFVVLSVDFSLAVSAMSAPVRYDELAHLLGVPAGERVPLAEARAAVLALRARKGMVLMADDPDTYSVGSFFTNPVLDQAGFADLRRRGGDRGEPPAWPGPDGTVKISAAWLIERAGFTRGYGRPGTGVAISGKHTLALTNRGGGSTAALLELAREIRAGVRDRFGLTLHPEPVLVNCRL